MATYDEMKNQGLQIFQEAYGRAPESEVELGVVNSFNQKMTNQAQASTQLPNGYQTYPSMAAGQPATVYDTAVNNAYQSQQEFAQPNVFLQTIKAGLSAKLQPQEENLGTSQLFEKAGLTGYSTLAQSMAARTNQLIKSGADLAKALDSSAGVYKDYYNLLNDNYKTLLGQQQAAVERQYEVEDQIREFNNKLYMVQRQEELDRESAQIQSRLDVWEAGQKSSISMNETAWENALSQQTYAYKSQVDIAEEEAKIGLGLQEAAAKANITLEQKTNEAEIEAGLAQIKEELKRDTNLSDAQISAQLKTTESQLRQQEDLTQAQLDVYVAEAKQAIKDNTTKPAVPTATTQPSQTQSTQSTGFQLPSGYEKIDGAKYSTRDAQKAAYDDIRTDPTGKFLYGKPKSSAGTPSQQSATPTNVTTEEQQFLKDIAQYKQVLQMYGKTPSTIASVKSGIKQKYPGLTDTQLDKYLNL